MLSYCVIHLLILAVGVVLLWRMCSSRFTHHIIGCRFWSNIDLAVFILLNGLICYFSFRSYSWAFVDAADVFIFDTQISFLNLLFPAPVLILVGRVMATTCCTGIYLGLPIVCALTCQSFLSLVLLRVYLSFHQKELKNIEGYYFSTQSR